jgi:acyl-CoA dehydrogenase
MCLKMAKVAALKLPSAGEKMAFYDAKLKTARFYFSKILPQVNALNLAVMAGSKPVMDFPEEAF